MQNHLRKNFGLNSCFHEGAREMGDNRRSNSQNLNMRYINALKSIKKYPFLLKSGSDYLLMKELERKFNNLNASDDDERIPYEIKIPAKNQRWSKVNSGSSSSESSNKSVRSKSLSKLMKSHVDFRDNRALSNTWLSSNKKTLLETENQRSKNAKYKHSEALRRKFESNSKAELLCLLEKRVNERKKLQNEISSRIIIYPNFSDSDTDVPLSLSSKTRFPNSSPSIQSTNQSVKNNCIFERMSHHGKVNSDSLLSKSDMPSVKNKIKSNGSNKSVKVEHKLHQANSDSSVVTKLKNNSSNRKFPKIGSSSIVDQEFKPAIYSPAYAILVSLLHHQYKLILKDGLLKTELIQFAQPLCNTSFTEPEAGNYYTAWTVMKTIVAKGLVSEHGRPIKYKLTEDGVRLAMKLERVDVHLQTNNSKVTCSIASLPKSDSSVDSTTSFVSDLSEIPYDSSFDKLNVIFQPFSFDVILIVDTHEVIRGKNHPYEGDALLALRNYNLKYEVRNLKVGDFAWIGRHRVLKEEIVFPYLIERKCEESLQNSLREQEYRQQSNHLIKCGIRHLLYLLEHNRRRNFKLIASESDLKNSDDKLIQSMVQIKYSNDLEHSIQYVAGLTEFIKRNFENKTLVTQTREQIVNPCYDNGYPVLTYKDFSKETSKLKKYHVKEMFVQQLLYIKGMTIEKALAIVSAYPSPQSLECKYKELELLDAEKLLSIILCKPSNKTVGINVSRAVFQYYTTKKLMFDY